MTGNLKLLHDYNLGSKSLVQIVDGTIVSAQGHGSVRITDKLTLDGVLYVLECTSNLNSVSRLIDSNYLSIIFDFEKAILLDNHSQMLTGKAICRRGLYVIQSEAYCAHVANNNDKLTMLWHCRAGQPSHNVLKKMISSSI